MTARSIPSERAFHAVRNISVEELAGLEKKELRCLLPCLVRMALCAASDQSNLWENSRKQIQKILSGIEMVNSIVALLSVDFSLLEQDSIKEQQLRRKIGSSGSVLIDSLQHGLALEFERSEPERRLRLVLSDILRIMSKVEVEREFAPDSSELFECDVYLEEVSDVLCIAQAELPTLLPMKKLAEALLRVKYGSWLLCKLVVNMPDSFEQVCSSLLLNAEAQDEESLGGKVRTQTLRQLCTMYPSHSLSVRAEAVRLCCLPGLTVALTLDYVDAYHTEGASEKTDLVTFISGLLLGSEQNVREWFALFVKNGQKHNPETSTSMLALLRRQLLRQVTSLIPRPIRNQLHLDSIQLDRSLSDSMIRKNTEVSMDHSDTTTLEIVSELGCSGEYEVIEEAVPLSLENIHNHQAFEMSEEEVVKGSALLRLYCALKGIAAMKLTAKESEELLCLITCRPPPNAAGVRFVVIGLCTLLSLSYIISVPEHEQAVIQWIEWLSKEEAYYESASGVQSSFGEVLLLIAIHFHANNVDAVRDLMSSILGMRIRPGSLTRIKTLFTQQLFPEKVVTAHAVTVPVTPNLSADVTGFLPVHCIVQLLKSKAFTKHGVQAKDWIYGQICASTMPLHPLMPRLIESFVNSIIIPLPSRISRTHSSAAALQGFTEAQILSVFEENKGEAFNAPSDSLTPKLLMLFYVLTYQDVLFVNMKALEKSQRAHSSHPGKVLSAKHFSIISIKHLFQQARSLQQQLRGLYPPLLRLLATHFPHLCQVSDWLMEEELCISPNKTSSERDSVRMMCEPEKLQDALLSSSVNPSAALILLTRLSKLEPSQLLVYMDTIVQALPSLLDKAVPRRVQALCCNLWMSINTVVPRKLWLLTVNEVCHGDQKSSGLPLQLYTEDDLMKDPLIVLRCDQRIYRCPPLFDIMLNILTGYLAGARALLAQHIQINPTPKSSNSVSVAVDQEREELKSALILAQESATAQILLEICLPQAAEKECERGSMSHCVLREIQCRVCSVLHQMFIADPTLMKLIHFQGYKTELLPVTVSGVPSMHICLDFIPELISQPQLEKQFFAVQLASFLCLEYPLPKAMSVVKCVLNCMKTMLSGLPADKRTLFFLPALPALVRFCQAFPPLCEEVCVFLIHLGKVMNCVMAISGSTAQAGTSTSILQQLHSGKFNMLSVKDTEDAGFHDTDTVNENYDKMETDSAADDEDTAQENLHHAIEKTFLELQRVCVLNRHGCSN